MTLDDIIASARSRAGDIDAAAYRYSAEEYVAAFLDVFRTARVRGAMNLAQVTYDPTTPMISPEPTDLQGTYLAAALALRMLEQTYRRRLDEGSLGISWVSGLEQESSISAEKAYSAVLDTLRLELTELIIFGNANTFAARKQ